MRFCTCLIGSGHYTVCFLVHHIVRLARSTHYSHKARPMILSYDKLLRGCEHGITDFNARVHRQATARGSRVDMTSSFFVGGRTVAARVCAR